MLAYLWNRESLADTLYAEAANAAFYGDIPVPLAEIERENGKGSEKISTEPFFYESFMGFPAEWFPKILFYPSFLNCASEAFPHNHGGRWNGICSSYKEFDPPYDRERAQ